MAPQPCAPTSAPSSRRPDERRPAARARLLSDAVSRHRARRPARRIRASASTRRTRPWCRCPHGRSWIRRGGIVATAAVIGVVAYVSSVAGDDSARAERPRARRQPATPSGTGGIATDTACVRRRADAASIGASRLPAAGAASTTSATGPGRRALPRAPRRARPPTQPLDAASTAADRPGSTPTTGRRGGAGWLDCRARSAGDTRSRSSVGDARAGRPASSRRATPPRPSSRRLHACQAAVQKPGPGAVHGTTRRSRRCSAGLDAPCPSSRAPTSCCRRSASRPAGRRGVTADRGRLVVTGWRGRCDERRRPARAPGARRAAPRAGTAPAAR